MSRIWRGLPLSIAAAALAVGLGAATPAAAAGALPAPMVIIIDYTEVVRDSSAGKAVLAQRDKYVQEFQTEVSRDEQRLRDDEKALANQQGQLTRDQFQDKYRAFQQKVQDMQKRAQDRRKAIDDAFNKAMTAIQRELVKVVDEIASEQGANLVLLKSQVFLHEPKFEITATAVERLNKRVPSVEFPAPVAASGASTSTKATDKKKK
jgi:outer membrane protein